MVKLVVCLREKNSSLATKKKTTCTFFMFIFYFFYFLVIIDQPFTCTRKKYLIIKVFWSEFLAKFFGFHRCMLHARGDCLCERANFKVIYGVQEINLLCNYFNFFFETITNVVSSVFFYQI